MEVAHAGRDDGRFGPRPGDHFHELREGMVPEFSRPIEVATSVQRPAERRLDDAVPLRERVHGADQSVHAMDRRVPVPHQHEGAMHEARAQTTRGANFRNERADVLD